MLHSLTNVYTTYKRQNIVHVKIKLKTYKIYHLFKFKYIINCFCNTIAKQAMARIWLYFHNMAVLISKPFRNYFLKIIIKNACIKK